MRHRLTNAPWQAGRPRRRRCCKRLWLRNFSIARLISRGVHTIFAVSVSRQQAPQICALCGRIVPPELITLHHLLPKQKGGVADDRVPMCKPCHKQIHAAFTNTELAQRLNTLSALRGSRELRGFLSWIRKQKPGRNFRTQTARRRR